MDYTGDEKTDRVLALKYYLKLYLAIGAIALIGGFLSGNITIKAYLIAMFIFFIFMSIVVIIAFKYRTINRKRGQPWLGKKMSYFFAIVGSLSVLIHIALLIIEGTNSGDAINLVIGVVFAYLGFKGIRENKNWEQEMPQPNYYTPNPTGIPEQHPPEESNKKIWIFIGIFILIIAGISFYFAFEEGNTAADVLTPEACNQLPNEANRSVCFAGLAIISNDSSFCDQVLDDTSRSLCFAGLAIINSDSSFCDQVPLEDEQSSCYFVVASDTKDESICSKNSDREKERICFIHIAELSENPEVCKGLEVRIDIDVCYYVLAKNLNNPEICENIPDEVRKSKCVANI